MIEYGTSVIRPDIVKAGEGCPIWNDEDTITKYVYGQKRRESRWLEDTEGFQIKYRGKWWNAMSIDFD